MQSISENCYQVFDQMIKQIRSDGGTFSSRPTSVKSNIDNGAYGIFRVSAISEIYFIRNIGFDGKIPVIIYIILLWKFHHM